MIYSESDVQEIVDALFDEADIAIEGAFADGYKQGVLEYAPKVESLEYINKELKKSIQENYNKAVLQMVGIGVGGVIFGGLVTAAVIGVLQ